MTTYLCRDFLTLGGTYSGKFESFYLTSIFLRRVMKYSHVGYTGVNINTVGSFLLGTGDTTPSSTPTWPVGTKAGINYGTGKEYHVGIPNAGAGGYTVSAGDANRILVLRSTANPKHNSGCFRITGTDVPNNRFIIDWRSAETPPAEAGDTIEWYLYAAENNNASTVYPYAGVGGGGNYTGRGSAANNPRIILQSGHSSGWQVRLCAERYADYNTNGTVPPCSFTPGFSGDGYGDYPTGANGGLHLHPAMWYDSASTNYNTGLGLGGNLNPSAWGNVHRISIVADDGYQNVCVVQRYVSGSDNTDYGTCHFGIPDNEPTPPANINRLYVIGGGSTGSNYCGNGFAHNTIGVTTDGMQGTGFGVYGRPCMVTYGAYGYLAGSGALTDPFTDASAADSVWTSATELMPVELIAGFSVSWVGGAVVFPLEGRSMGTVPFLRQGRSNFGNWTLTTDKVWYHTTQGAFLSWGGPAVLA